MQQVKHLVIVSLIFIFSQATPTKIAAMNAKGAQEPSSLVRKDCLCCFKKLTRDNRFTLEPCDHRNYCVDCGNKLKINDCICHCDGGFTGYFCASLREWCAGDRDYYAVTDNVRRKGVIAIGGILFLDFAYGFMNGYAQEDCIACESHTLSILGPLGYRFGRMSRT